MVGKPAAVHACSRSFKPYRCWRDQHMTLPDAETDFACAAPEMQWKLWIYTNYDCNLRCSYCVAKSSPNAPRRAIGLANVKRLVDDSVALGFTDVFFTGGEPFILNDIYDMLAYA